MTTLTSDLLPIRRLSEDGGSRRLRPLPDFFERSLNRDIIEEALRLGRSVPKATRTAVPETDGEERLSGRRVARRLKSVHAPQLGLPGNTPDASRSASAFPLIACGAGDASTTPLASSVFRSPAASAASAGLAR